MLQGGPVTIGDAVGCQIELSTLPLYQSQETYAAFLDYFRERDYVLWAQWPGLQTIGTAECFSSTLFSSIQNISASDPPEQRRRRCRPNSLRTSGHLLKLLEHLAWPYLKLPRSTLPSAHV